MEQRNIKILTDLLKRPGNGQCADCGSKEIEYASYNLGIFLCPRCTQLHNQMGSHISKTKHLKLDHWEDSQIDRMKQVGNLVAKAKYEARVPVGFRRPVGLMPSSNYSSMLPTDPPVLIDHWITSKYTRQEFTGDNASSDQHSFSSSSSPLRPYLSGVMDSFLMKKGREDPRYFPRRFVLDSTTLRYFVKEKSNPKAVIRLIDLDVCLNPVKCVSMGNVKVPVPVSSTSSSCLQLSYLKEGSTRHLYVFHDDSERVMQWYHAIRIAKLNALKDRCQISNVFVPESVLLSFIPQDSLIEGYLWKNGPMPSYAHRRRWFTLSPHRKLMYHVDPLDPYPKGEIFIGTFAKTTSDPTLITAASKIFDIEIKKPESLSTGGYKVSLGGFGDDKMDPDRWVFSLHTPYRTFVLSADTQGERDKWINVLNNMLKIELTPRDVATYACLVKKRNGSSLASISVPFSGLLSSSSSSSSPSSGPSLASSNIDNSNNMSFSRE